MKNILRRMSTARVVDRFALLKTEVRFACEKSAHVVWHTLSDAYAFSAEALWPRPEGASAHVPIAHGELAHKQTHARAQHAII